MKNLWIIIGCILVASCGPLVKDSQINQLTSKLSPAQQQAVPPPEQAQAAQAAMAQTDQIAFAIVSLNSGSRAFALSRNGRKVTWLTTSGESITLDNGLLVATRGLGDDLMGANVSGSLRAIRAGGGEALREASCLGSEDQIIRRVFTCKVTRRGKDVVKLYGKERPATAFIESCTGEGITFENQYWIGAEGEVWQARQWVSPQIGYIDSQRL
jgi:hypothetical protein